MKQPLFTSLPLRYKFVAIAFIGMVSIAITFAIANHLSTQTIEQRYTKQIFSIQEHLWQRILKTEFEQLEIATSSMRRNQRIARALKQKDDDHVQEQGEELFTRLLGAHILHNLQITDTKGNIKYRSDNSTAQTNSMPAVKQVLQNQTLFKDIDTTVNNELNSIVAFPLFSGGDFVGVGINIRSLQSAIKTFATDNDIDIFVVTKNNRFIQGTNPALFKRLQPSLPTSDDVVVKHYKLADAYFAVSTHPVKTSNNKTIAYFYAVRNITDDYIAQRNNNLFIYSGIILGIVLIVIALSYYIFYSLKPLNDLLHVVHDMRSGETTARVNVKNNDEIGELGDAFNKMTDELVETLHKEMIEKEDLEGKISLLLETVQQIAQGDLSAEVMVFSGDESIDKLAAGIQSMIDSLNELVSQVQQSGIQVTSSITEIASAAKEQEATVTEQAATTNQIMATATQISATSHELANTMHEVADIADKTTVSANDGQDALASMENTMLQMSDATASITSKLAVLSEKAANINTVVTTITKVADQTNLLSLNAAIEAEKAGEYGLGFAVVATEIRRLADQTAVATWDIEQMVKEMQSAVSAGVMGMDKFSEEVTRGVDEVRQIGSQLAQIIEEVQTLTPRFDAVNEGMQSQSHGAQQISDGMVQLNEATQLSVESLRQSNTSIDKLKQAANALQDGISQFRVKIKQGLS